MTKAEFLKNVPDIIEHKEWGCGELEIITDSTFRKGVCYRHQDKNASFGTFGSNWLEVYEQLTSALSKQGFN